MLARQVRLLILAKELKAEGVPGNELGARLRLSGYPLRKTLDQERAFTSARLVETHRRLLEADLSMKSTGADSGLVIDVLVAQLSSA
jgi:DNA polymerase III delta subunit